MSPLKDAVIDYIRAYRKHINAEEYAKKRQKEKMNARDALVQLLPRNEVRIVSINDELVMVENGPNGIQFRKAVFINE